MTSHGTTLTQLATYTAMISEERNKEFTVMNQEGFYERFCAAKNFEEEIEEHIYMGFHEVQRSSTPLFDLRDTDLLAVQFETENAALLMLMGQALIEENVSIIHNKSIDYSEWEIRIQKVQRSSTPLPGSREPEMLIVPFEKEDAALFMLMGHQIIETDY